jgi:hypothetical protein
MKRLLILAILLSASTMTYANSSIFSLSKLQQNRLNIIIKQLKIPQGDYKLTISLSGIKLESLQPIESQVITKEVEVIKEVVKEVPVEVIKTVTVEKQLPPGTITISPEEKKTLRTRCYDNWYGWNQVCVDEFLYSKFIK